MSQRKKLNLEFNKPTVFELLYDEPALGNSKYGNYYLYSIKNENNKEFSFFAADDAHQQLKNLKRGDKVEITKINEHIGDKVKTKFEVKTIVNQD